MLTVHQLAAKSDVPASVVRHYLRIGLIQPSGHQTNGYRLFESDNVSRLKFVRLAKYLGFTLNEIQSILEHADQGESPCPQVREIIQRRIRENREKLKEMTQLQRRMEAAVRAWQDMPDGEPDGKSVCHLIESHVVD